MTIPIGAGVILVSVDERNGEEPRFLLLRGRDTGIWSFSKGHTEATDRDLRSTALRETWEETGLIAGRDYTLVEGVAPMRFGKRPYWIGVTNIRCPTIRLCSREHSTSNWFTVSEIAQLKSNTDVRMWLRKIGGHFAAVMRALLLTLSCETTESTHLSDAVCNAS
jgi:8-oxo-dGTP pyrophosphatase MutT (NUDIX family)